MSDFVHLHCHSEYSFMNSTIRLKDLCCRAQILGMPAVALTDHGNMHGALRFRQRALEHGIKPIIGCEIYVSTGARTDKTATNAHEAAYHLVLLAKNRHGYQNLIRIVTTGYLEGFHFVPRVDKELLSLHSDGLIVLSACLRGEMARTLLTQGEDSGIAVAREYAAIFPDRFYLELRETGIPDQTRANEMLIEVAKATGLPLVATNNCHYLTRDDAEAHDVLLGIGDQRTMRDNDRLRMGATESYFKSMEEMEAAFAYCPEAISNTAKIAAQCDFDLEPRRMYFPSYSPPEGVSIEEEFRRMAREGLQKRLDSISYTVEDDAYWKRLEHEIKIIEERGSPANFLMVQDIINWAKGRGIIVGPGRGSVTGSLVAWALKITNLDPIPHDLLFECYLNSERVSRPDIYLDICEQRRMEIVGYMAEKYGYDRVAQLSTFSTMGIRSVVRDVGRVLGVNSSVTDRISLLIPEGKGVPINWVLSEDPELQSMVGGNPQAEKLMDISRRLEGLIRCAETDATNIVISDRPLLEYLPLSKGKEGKLITQYDWRQVKKLAFFTLELQGVRALTRIGNTLEIIRNQGNIPPDLNTLPLTDIKAYELFCSGNADGIFIDVDRYFKEMGLSVGKYMSMFRPTCFEDIIAMLALYRPGPLSDGMMSEFIKRKHGQAKVSCPHPSLERTLKPTYGLIVHREQAMRCAQIIANYSLDEGDMLCRVLAKKIPEEIAQHRKCFMAGARENNINESTAAQVFDLIGKVAGSVSFKSHYSAYGLISYYTAYLKAHFPVEFMSARNIISPAPMDSQMGMREDRAERKILITDEPCASTFTSSRDALNSLFNLIVNRAENHSFISGVSWGYKQLDEWTAGLNPSDLIIIAGSPGMGKTAFALNVALHASTQAEKSVAVFSLEMSTEQLIQRMLSIQGRVELSRMRTGFHLTDEDWDKLYGAAHQLSPARLFIDDTPALTAMEIGERCRCLKAEKGLDLVVVDNLQLMFPIQRIDSREHECATMSRSLKNLAKKMNIPIIALSQLNYDLKNRVDKRPLLSDLREFGAIEQNADVIMFLYRESHCTECGAISMKERAEVIIAKQRNGPIGTMGLTFQCRYTSFDPWEEDSDYPELQE